MIFADNIIFSNWREYILIFSPFFYINEIKIRCERVCFQGEKCNYQNKNRFFIDKNLKYKVCSFRDIFTVFNKVHNKTRFKF